MFFPNFCCRKNQERARRNSEKSPKILEVDKENPQSQEKSQINDEYHDICLNCSARSMMNPSNSPIRNMKASEMADLTRLQCNKCSLCSNCIFNLFEENLSSKKKMTILCCVCNLHISYKIFEPFILKENLLTYLEALSRLKIINSKKFICNYCFKLSKTFNETSGFSNCDHCRTKACLKCLQSHDETVSCKENFFKNQDFCEVCKKNEKFELNCGCFICQKCQYLNIKEQIEFDPLNSPKCKICQKVIPTYDQENVFGSREKLIRLKEDSLLAVRFQCMICLNNIIVDGSITLYCGHRYCKPCVTSHLNESIQSLPVNSTSLNCPSCSQEISFHIINSLLEGKMAELYQHKLLKNLKNQKKNEVLKFCDSCNYGAFISVDETRFRCPVCNKEMCPNCHGPVSEDCCKKMLMMKSSIGSLDGLIVSCPKCGIKIFKDGGCNFMKCESRNCTQGWFCMICNKVLLVRVR